MKKQKTQKLKTNKGITLIALVITIIVMLILVGVTISMAVNGGLFEYAGRAVGKTNEVMDIEKALANGRVKIGENWYNSIGEYLDSIKGSGVKLINFTIDGVTYYAEEGMTYGQWIGSQYNTTGQNFDVSDDGYFITSDGDKLLTWWKTNFNVSMKDNSSVYNGNIFYPSGGANIKVKNGDILSLDTIGYNGRAKPNGYFYVTIETNGYLPSFLCKEGWTWSDLMRKQF